MVLINLDRLGQKAASHVLGQQDDIDIGLAGNLQYLGAAFEIGLALRTSHLDPTRLDWRSLGQGDIADPRLSVRAEAKEQLDLGLRFTFAGKVNLVGAFDPAIVEFSETKYAVLHSRAHATEEQILVWVQIVRYSEHNAVKVRLAKRHRHCLVQIPCAVAIAAICRHQQLAAVIFFKLENRHQRWPCGCASPAGGKTTDFTVLEIGICDDVFRLVQRQTRLGLRGICRKQNCESTEHEFR